jgi:hypothetical protein
MDAFFHLSWRVWPAGAISAAGALLLVRGVARERRAFRTPGTQMAKPLGIASALRMLLLGSSLLALGLAWIFQIVWLFWLALIFGAEETRETSMVVSGLRQDARFKAAYARARNRAGSTASGATGPQVPFPSSSRDPVHRW